jgi:hypothetical protein
MTKYIHFLVSSEHGIKGSEQDKGGRSDLS